MATVNVGTLEALLRVRDTLTPQLKRSSRQLSKFGSSAKAAFAVAGAAALAASAVIVGIATKALQASIAFESSFTGIRKTVSATEEQFAELAAGMREMAKEIPVNVNELNRIGEAAGQLGIKTEHIASFTRTMAQLGVTTNLSSDIAATQLARLANITGMSATDFDRLGSVIVGLGNNFATTEAEIVTFATRIAAAGTLAGLSESDILAIGAAMSSVGVQAEAGGTAVQKVLIKMTRAAAEGGADLEGFAAAAGMSAQQFATAFQKDAAGAFASFVEGLGRSGIGAAKVLDDLNLKDTRLAKSFLSLAGAGTLLRDAIDLGTVSWRENLALQIEAALRFGTTASKVQLLKNGVNDLGIELGNNLAGHMAAVIDSLDELLSRAGETAEVVRNLTTIIINFGSGAMTAAQVAIRAAQMILLVWNTIRLATYAVLTGVLGLAEGLVTMLRVAFEAGQYIPILGAGFGTMAGGLKSAEDALEGLTDGMGLEAEAARQSVLMRDGLNGALIQTSAALSSVQDAYRTASATVTTVATPATDAATAAVGANTQAAAANAVAISAAATETTTYAAAQAVLTATSGTAATAANALWIQMQHDAEWARTLKGGVVDVDVALAEAADKFTTFATLDLPPRQESWLGAIREAANYTETATIDLRGAFSAASESLMELGKIAGSGIFGSIVQGLGSVTGSADAAFTGFDTLKKGFGAFKAASSLTGTISSIGTMASGVGAIIPIALLAFQGIKKLFSLGGPSEAEKAGRAASDRFKEFTAEILTTSGALTVNKLVAEGWSRDLAVQVVAVGDKYKALGLTQEQANRDVKAVWDAIKDGPDAVAAAVAVIKGNFNQVSTAAQATNRAINTALRHRRVNIQINETTTRSSSGSSGSGGGGGGFSARHGTGGKFMDFGTGTPATLHGNERVVTEAEGVAEATGIGALAGKLDSIERLLKDQPRANALAMSDAILLTR